MAPLRLIVLLLAATSWLWPRLSSAETPLAFEVQAEAVPSRWCPGEQRRIDVVLRNTGSRTWDPAQRDRLSYHVLDPRGRMLVRDGLRTELPGKVAPGERVRLPALVQAPDTRGSMLLAWAMVREQVAWYPLPPDSTHELQVQGHGPPLAWSAQVSDVPPLRAKEEAELTVTITNRGCASWSAEHGDGLSYRWLDATGQVVVTEGLRTPLPDLAPGDTAQVRARVVGPPSAGSHILQLEPVREHVAWFGPPSEGNASVSIDVGRAALAWSLVGTLELPPVHAKEVVTVPLVLRNDGLQAWSPQDGDRLSYHWLDSSGEAVVPEGLRTMLPSTVQPGAEVTVRARVAAPPSAGLHTLAFELVREGVTWFGPPQAGPSAIPVDVRRPALAWSVLELDAPPMGWVARPSHVTVTVRNDGDATWSPEAADRLSYRWYDSEDNPLPLEGLRTELPGEVPPGHSVTVDVRVLGPSLPGDYRLELGMVREHVAWFGPPVRGGASVQLPVHFHSALLGAALVMLVVVTVLGLRRVARVRSAVLEHARPWLWPVWLAAVVWMIAEAFSDLSGLEFWEGGRLVAGSVGALVGALVLAVPRRFRPTTAVVLAVFLTVLAVADLAYVDFFGSLVPLTALSATHHLLDAGGSVASLMQPAYAGMMVLPLSGLPLALGLPWPRRSSVCVHGRWRRIVPALVLLASSVPSVVSLAEAMVLRGNQVFSEAQNAGRLGVVGAHVFQVLRAVSNLGGREPLDEQGRARVETFFADRARARAAAAGFGAAAGMNVILIQVEALQSWAVGAVVNGQPVTPFLDRSRSEALSFDHIWDQTGQGRTSDAEYLTLASNHALAEGALSFLRADAGFVTVAHALREQGYETLSAHPYRRGFWNRAVLHPRYGFSASLFRRELGAGPKAGWGLADGPFLDRIAARLPELPQPFFAFLITLSLHHPYPDFPRGLSELDLGELQGTSVGNYLQAMRHFDSSLARLFEHLRQTGLEHNTVVAIYGDHVTGLGEPPPVLEFAGLSDWDPSTHLRLHRVPVFVWIPNAPSELRGPRDRVGGHIDIGATVLHLLGVQAPGSFVGQPLTAQGESIAVLPDGSVVGVDRMFVRRGRDISLAGACFDRPSSTPRPRSDCDALEAAGRVELEASRAVLDHDLFDDLEP